MVNVYNRRLARLRRSNAAGRIWLVPSGALIEVADPARLENDDGVAFLAYRRAALPPHHQHTRVAFGEFFCMIDGFCFCVIDNCLPSFNGVAAFVQVEGEYRNRCERPGTGRISL
jgi:hypothetical protein